MKSLWFTWFAKYNLSSSGFSSCKLKLHWYFLFIIKLWEFKWPYISIVHSSFWFIFLSLNMILLSSLIILIFSFKMKIKHKIWLYWEKNKWGGGGENFKILLQFTKNWRGRGSKVKKALHIEKEMQKHKDSYLGG